MCWLCPCDEPLDLARTGLTIGEPSASMRPRKHRALTPLREVTETTPPCVLSPSDSPDPTFVLSRSGSGILSAF